MQIPNKTVVAVADGEKLNMFRNNGDERELKLVEEAGFAVGIAEMLNRRVLSGKVTSLVVIAAPRTLGELRKQYHKNLEAVLIGEIPKDLTGHSIQDIEKALAAMDA